MEWSESYTIGLSAIDSQHKRIFQLIRGLNEAIEAGVEISDVEKLFVVLDQYKSRHFQLEEKYMVESNYPGLKEQLEAHAHFSNRIIALRENLNQNGLTPNIVQAIQSELEEWLKEHVTSLDVVFGKYYQKKNEKQQE